MKPVFKNGIAIFYPFGFLDGGNIKGVVEPQDIAMLGNKCEIALISFKKVVFFNQRGISRALELLGQIQDRVGANIGFCDYDLRKYHTIMEMFQHNVPFSMFKSEKIAALYYRKPLPKNPEAQKIIIYNKDEAQKNQLALELAERGYKPTIAKNENELAEVRDEFDLVVEDSNVATKEKFINIFIKQNVVIYMLNGYIDSVFAERFDISYHMNSLKVGFKFFLFDASSVSSINIHGVNFLARLSTFAAEYGASVATCGLTDSNIAKSLKHDLEDAGILIYKTLRDFFEDDSTLEGGGALFQKKQKNLTKSLVEKLSLMTQITTETVQAMTRFDVIKQDIKLQEISLDENVDTISAAVAFYGDLEGMILLAFEKSTAQKACTILLDEGDDSIESLIEALGEFVNIIVGKIAQKLLRYKLKVEITMPRTYGDASEVMESYKGIKGAQVNFVVDSKPMSLFLTR